MFRIMQRKNVLKFFREICANAMISRGKTTRYRETNIKYRKGFMCEEKL